MYIHQSDLIPGWCQSTSIPFCPGRCIVPGCWADRFNVENNQNLFQMNMLSSNLIQTKSTTGEKAQSELYFSA